MTDEKFLESLLPYSSWEEFPSHQKYLAIGEALTHLRLLEEKGQVKKIEREGVIHYISKSLLSAMSTDR